VHTLALRMSFALGPARPSHESRRCFGVISARPTSVEMLREIVRDSCALAH
jgi:hypothetical protein